MIGIAHDTSPTPIITIVRAIYTYSKERAMATARALPVAEHPAARQILPVPSSSNSIIGTPCGRKGHIRLSPVQFSSSVLNFRADRHGVSVVCSAQVAASPLPVKPQSGTWTWKLPNGVNVSIFYEEYVKTNSSGELQTLLLLPTISDVSTTEEWRAVALNLLSREASKWQIVIVDWPGFGLSDRPRMEYTADNLEGFLVDFVNSAEGPLSRFNTPPIIVGAGHAASLAIRAIKKGVINAQAIAAVAPTWAGPMPIVFGREPDMESRYSLLRNSLQAPALGWMMYNFMVSSPNNIKKQYLSHVYADPNNVTPGLLESRLALTKREGARFAPAAFLTGLLDPVQTREQFLALVGELEGKVPVLVIAASKAPRRSKAEMEALKGAKGVSNYVEVEGALLPQEEYPDKVSEELFNFLGNV